MAKIQGKRYAYRFNFKALSLACQAQQSPMPSDAKIDDLNKVLAPLLHQKQQDSTSFDQTEQVSTTSSNEESTYQVPDRVLPPYESELPDLGSNIWSDFRWPQSASSSDCNSPCSSYNNVMSPGASGTSVGAAPVPLVPLMPPPPPPPTYEHSRSNSVPANMYYTDFEEL